MTNGHVFRSISPNGAGSNQTVQAGLRQMLQKPAAEEGRIKAGIQDNERLLREGSGRSGYRTVGEMIQKDPKFA